MNNAFIIIIIGVLVLDSSEEEVARRQGHEHDAYAMGSRAMDGGGIFLFNLATTD